MLHHSWLAFNLNTKLRMSGLFWKKKKPKKYMKVLTNSQYASFTKLFWMHKPREQYLKQHLHNIHCYVYVLIMNKTAW